MEYVNVTISSLCSPNLIHNNDVLLKQSKWKQSLRYNLVKVITFLSSVNNFQKNVAFGLFLELKNWNMEKTKILTIFSCNHVERWLNSNDKFVTKLMYRIENYWKNENSHSSSSIKLIQNLIRLEKQTFFQLHSLLYLFDSRFCRVFVVVDLF